MLHPVGIEPRPLIASHSPWFQVQHYPFYTNLTCKSETLRSLYIHALLIPLKSSKSNYQVVHEQKFKDLLSSTCQVSVQRIMLDLESEVVKGLGSIPTGGNILLLDFFHVVKPSMPILALLPMLCICENPEFYNFSEKGLEDLIWRELLFQTFSGTLYSIIFYGTQCR